MQSFRDKSGQDWTVDLTVGSIVRIRGESAGRFDLYNPVKDELATRLADDVPLCWELLWFVCSPQAKSRNLTAETFGQLLADDTLFDAQAAFFREWIDFFHRLRREELALVADKAWKYQAKKLELVRARLSDPTLTTLDERVERKMEAQLNDSFGSMRERFDSILGPSPSGSSPECSAGPAP